MAVCRFQTLFVVFLIKSFLYHTESSNFQELKIDQYDVQPFLLRSNRFGAEAGCS